MKNKPQRALFDTHEQVNMLVFGIWKTDPEKKVEFLAWSSEEPEAPRWTSWICCWHWVYPLNEFQAFKLNTKQPGRASPWA